MIVRPLAAALDGEHVVAVHPPMTPALVPDWHRRLHAFTGRALSDAALTAQQAHRAGHLALFGQTLSAGVVSGLEADVQTDGARDVLHVAPGAGLTASGEDVVVPFPVRVDLHALAVDAPARLLDGQPGGAGGAVGRLVEARRLSARPLGELLAAGVPLPPVGVVVLQPVVVERIARAEDDACELDPQDFAFEDWQLVDACRLVWYAWPTDWRTLPPADDRWRNRLAHTVFAAEQAHGSDDVMPWEALGVPVALVALDETTRRAAFADRASVVRAGGRPRRRTGVMDRMGNPFLWDARAEQLVEQLTDMQAADPARTDYASALRYLPPVGLLPRGVVEPREGLDRFFPRDYVVQAVPVPLEQLDVVVEDSAPLAPYDLFSPDTVRVLVPVPQAYYEPALLRHETVGPEFQAAIERFSVRRGKWLRRRTEVRAMLATLDVAIDGQARAFPTPDPGALEPETEASDPLDPSDPQLAAPEESYGTTLTRRVRTADALEALKAELRARTPIRWRTSVAAELADDRLPDLPASLAARVTFDAASKQLTFTGRVSDAERTQLLRASEAPRWTEAVTALATRSQDDDLAELEARGVRGFIDFLREKVQRADDRVDFGFLRVQTDIYRIRQLALGVQAGSRLATSPTLASIAQGESAVATQETLKTFLDRLKVDDQPRTVAPLLDVDARVAANAPPSELAREVPLPIDASAIRAGVESRGASAIRDVKPTLSDRVVPGVGGVVRPALGEEVSLKMGLDSLRERLGGSRSGPLDLGGLVDERTRIDLVESGVKASALNLPSATTAEITGQAAIVGKALNFRTVTVAERLQQPPAPEAKTSTVASKFAVVNELAGLSLNLDDVQVPGFYELDERGRPRTRDDPVTGKARFIETTHSFAAIRDRGLAAQIIGEQHDPDPANGDEAAFFSAGVRALDHSVAVLRAVEGRVQGYRRAIELATRRLAELEGHVARAESRLTVVADELAEARQDVATARALLADEKGRVTGVNARRDQVIAEHVTVLAFHRPRFTELVLDFPARTVDPGLVAAPVPACLADDRPVPRELRAMVDLLRDVPVRWLVDVPSLLDRLDRVETLRRTVQVAQLRAVQHAPRQALAVAPAADGSRLGTAIASLYDAQRTVVAARRAAAAQGDLVQLVQETWARTRDRAPELVSLGDLIDGGHGNATVAQRATATLHDMARVAACLYAGFAEVLPSVRLLWAERLSQFDAAANLRNLASLPRWGEIAYLDRRAMQGIVDWLFARVDPRVPEAVSLVNDLVRVCLLLASHSPVSRIIAGHVQRDMPVRVGGRVDLVIDVSLARVGMLVHLYQGSDVVAHAVVEDVGAGLAAARVTQAASPTINLAAGARAQFVAAGSASGRSVLAIAASDATSTAP